MESKNNVRWALVFSFGSFFRNSINRNVSRIVFFIESLIFYGGMIAPAYSTEALDPKAALQSMDSSLVHCRKALKDNDAGKLSTLIFTFLGPIGDQPKVIAFYEEIISSEANAGCVGLGLSHLPVGRKPAQIARWKKDHPSLLQSLLRNPSLWVRLQAVTTLCSSKKDVEGLQTCVTLATIRDWEMKLEEELPSLIKAHGGTPAFEKEVCVLKAHYVSGLLSALEKYEAPAAQTAISTFLQNDRPIKCLEQGVASTPVNELKKNWNELAHKYAAEKK